jgi:murein DD-endopeptidase MepM/ murein hydrolase activator NlpD
MEWRKATLTLGDGKWGFGTVTGGPALSGGAYPITSPFGPRSPIDTQAGTTSGFHQGLDIGYPDGTPLVAMFRAFIRYAVSDHPSLGNYVIMETADADVGNPEWAQVWYGHLKTAPLVTEGEIVEEGVLVGYVGSSGMANGPHLHLEVRNSVGCIDPYNALMAGGLGKQQAAEPEPQPYQPLTRQQVADLVLGGALYADLGPATNAVVIFK